MIFNWWHKYPKHKPKKKGWYQCTVRYGREINGTPCVLRLFYCDWRDIWINDSRQQVFDGYKVYKVTRATIEENRVYGDSLCERNDVIAWKKLPKVYGWRKLKNKKENEHGKIGLGY